MILLHAENDTKDRQLKKIINSMMRMQQLACRLK